MRATINSSGIQKRFWHEILKSCCLGLNQIPKKGCNKSPWEMLHNKSFPIGLLKSIGTPAVVLNMAKVKGRKFDSKGEEGILIGFNVSLQSYRILTQTGRVIETKHVRFMKKTNSQPTFPQTEEHSDHGENSNNLNDSSDPREEESDLEADNSDIEKQLVQAESTTQTPEVSTRILRDRSQLRPPIRYGFHHYYEPNTFESAIRCEDSKHWRQAIEKEVSSIESHDVWEDYNDEPPNPLNTTWNWYKTLTKWLNSIGFYESSSDPCLYLCDDNISRVFFHVDDLILVGPGNNFEIEFENRFKNSSRHAPNTILGMKFERDNNQIKLSLPNHIQHGLEELGLVNCKSSVTPLTPNLKLVEATNEDHARFKKLNINYRSAIGLLNHIAQLTRPDISFAVSSLARFSVKPGMTHWHEVKKVWQYLKGTADLKLSLSIKEPDNLLQIYSDASWGDDPQDRTSQSGYLCFLFGTLISWNSSKQRSVTYSSTEAELNPLVDLFHEGIWLKAVLTEIWNIQIDSANHLIDDPELEERLMMTEEEFKEKFCNEHLIDNKGLDDKVKKFGSNPKTRHIDLKMKGLRQEVKHQNIRVSLIRTSEMVADALTKPVSRSSIENLSHCIDSDFRGSCSALTSHGEC
ncbi:hypothetical protein VP01_166g2 [Puccinia sorghi]|uniref:Retroviral polymerase SH3-like domain-containing protein n=1 Tax=Puccinia sorghi TaxID=27349 RepID=A0A0L6VHY8_9BASI|nr:hypothetical protein VP01_166g2 [Puccinia sorghi]